MIKGAIGRSVFLLEEDMGSEPVQRESLEGTAIFRKVLAYIFTYDTKLLQGRYGIPGFWVLFVTNSRERAEHMTQMYTAANDALKAYQIRAGHKPTGCPPNVFLFIDRETLRPSDIFSVQWFNGKGELKTIERP
jgi:hypothetical protein